MAEYSDKKILAHNLTLLKLQALIQNNQIDISNDKELITKYQNLFDNLFEAVEG